MIIAMLVVTFWLSFSSSWHTSLRWFHQISIGLLKRLGQGADMKGSPGESQECLRVSRSRSRQPKLRNNNSYAICLSFNWSGTQFRLSPIEHKWLEMVCWLTPSLVENYSWFSVRSSPIMLPGQCFQTFLVGLGASPTSSDSCPIESVETSRTNAQRWNSVVVGYHEQSMDWLAFFSGLNK